MGGIEFRDRINNKGKFHGILLIFRAFNTQSISFIAMQENQNPKDKWWREAPPLIFWVLFINSNGGN
jgi:hypothetical protein